MFIDAMPSTALGNGLHDSQVSLRFRDLPYVYERIQSELSDYPIGHGTCISLECDNTVVTAVLLLFLLDNGHSVFLYPKSMTKSPSSRQDRGKIPHFCTHVLMHAPDTSKREWFADRFFQISLNPRWNGRKVGCNKLYVRTSGTTSHPKIVAHSFAKLRNNALNCGRRLQLSEADRVAIPVPLFHMYGLGAAFLSAILVGASIDLQERSNLLRFLEREGQFRPTTSFLTPSFCEAIDEGRRLPRHYKLTVVAGDRMRSAGFVKHEASGSTLIQLYGSTEMGVIASASPRDLPDVRERTVGTALPSVSLKVEEIETQLEGGRSGPLGQIWCKHQNAFEGYVDDGGEVVRAYDCTWWNTMDLGYLDSDAHLEIIGRADQCVNRDGRLVSFSSIERVLEAEAVITKVVATTGGDAKRGKELVIYCVPKLEASLTESDVERICRRVLPMYAIPDKVVVTRSLPLLNSGKVDRRALRLIRTV